MTKGRVIAVAAVAIAFFGLIQTASAQRGTLDLGFSDDRVCASSVYDGDNIACRAGVETTGATAIQPPSTGDGGLLDAARDLDIPVRQALAGVFVSIIVLSFWLVAHPD